MKHRSTFGAGASNMTTDPDHELTAKTREVLAGLRREIDSADREVAKWKSLADAFSASGHSDSAVKAMAHAVKACKRRDRLDRKCARILSEVQS